MPNPRKPKTEPEQNADDEKLIHLISPEFRMDTNLERATENLQGNFVLLLIVSPRQYSYLQCAVLRHFVKKLKLPGIYITVNKPFETLKSSFDRDNLDISQVMFIDMVTEMAGGKPLTAANCKYFESTTDLTELVEYLNSISSSSSKNKFVIIDSVSTLLVYNEPNEVEKVLHTIVAKSHEWGLKTILLAIENKEQKSIIETISQFCDRVFPIV